MRLFGRNPGQVSDRNFDRFISDRDFDRKKWGPFIGMYEALRGVVAWPDATVDAVACDPYGSS